MAYSPHLARTPQTPRAKTSSSAPPTPHVGYTVPDRSRTHTHHYAGILMQHDSSNSDTSVGYISPTHRTMGTSYGTLQTDVSSSCLQANKHLVVEIPDLNDNHLPSETALYRPVAWIWVITNMVVFGFCTFSLLQPNWLTNPSTQASLGLVNYCEEGASLSTEQEKCQYYPRKNNFPSTLSSAPWQFATIVYAIASTILGVSALLTSLCLCVSRISVVSKLSLIAGLQQLVSAILLLTSLVTVPVGFDAREVREICGAQSGLYNAGGCHVGWSFIIPSGCCVLCFILPVLSHYVTYVPKYQNLS